MKDTCFKANPRTLDGSNSSKMVLFFGVQVTFSGCYGIVIRLRQEIASACCLIIFLYYFETVLIYIYIYIYTNWNMLCA